MYLDAKGMKLGEPEGRDVAAFTAGLEAAEAQAAKLDDLRARAAKGDKKAKAELFLIEFELGAYTYAEAKAKAKELQDLTPEQKKKLGQMLINGEFQEILSTVRSQEAAMEAAPKLKKMLDAGRVPDGPAADTFWSILMEWADENEKAKVFGQALAYFKDKYGDNERAKPFFEEKEARLEEMKKKQADG